jgi:hypothetical protein
MTEYAMQEAMDVADGTRGELILAQQCGIQLIELHRPQPLYLDVAEARLDVVGDQAAIALPAAHWIEGKPESIWILTPRPSLPPASYIRAGNEPSGGGQDFAWLIFNVQASIDGARIRWLHRDGGAP